MQDVFVILCANSFAALRQFRGERPEALVTYLRTIAASVAVDSIRASNAKKRGSGRVSQFADEDASDVIHNAEDDLTRNLYWTRLTVVSKETPKLRIVTVGSSGRITAMASPLEPSRVLLVLICRRKESRALFTVWCVR